jgi:hypothetical protein
MMASRFGILNRPWYSWRQMMKAAMTTATAPNARNDQRMETGIGSKAAAAAQKMTARIPPISAIQFFQMACKNANTSANIGDYVCEGMCPPAARAQVDTVRQAG